MSILTLPEDVTYHILAYLDPDGIGRLCRVCKAWDYLRVKDDIWSVLCRKYGVKKKTEKFRESFIGWYREFKYYVEVYPRLQDLFDRFVKWASSVGYECKVGKGVSYMQIREVTEKIRVFLNDMNFNLPSELACWLLIGDLKCVDLYGSYSFYDHDVVMRALTIDQIGDFVNKFQIAKFCTGLIPFAGKSPHKMYFIVNTPQPNLPRGQIVTNGLDSLFPVADNFGVFLEHYILQLERGNYRLRSGRISLFPKLNIPTAITNHVKITASPLFIPERSRQGQYLWAYSITLSMDNNTPKGYECQLRSRHWEITSVGRTEEVNGAGVIGEYPKMFPGAEFTYESCCPLVDDSGTMGGSFQMKRDADGQLFDAVVPVFTFSVPTIIKESDLVVKKENNHPTTQNNNNTKPS